jgi:S1-C subfamily serine protease
MDIKDLNKQQLILLGLLLSFVVSIATSITTVTLMQQAPASITVPINRVIQQTVEKIQQVEGKTITQTVVVKEEDLVVDAISKNQSAVFSISKDVPDESGKLTEIFVGRGFAVNNEGLLVSDASVVPALGLYYVKNESGKFKADFMGTNKDTFSFLKVGAPLDEKNKLTYTLPTFGDIDKMKIGQKILVLGSTITSYVFDGNKDLRLNINKGNAGAMVLNLDGELLGLAILNDNASFVSMNHILDVLKAKETPKVP